MVSIIVPVYKCENSLKKCVRSILDQTYTNLEIILVDDGSPDKSGQMCDELALTDKRIKVIHKKNGGVSSARNAGLRQAQGEYIQFVDSDDYLDHTMTERFVEKIEETNSDCVICGRTEISEETQTKIEVPETDCIDISDVKKICPGFFADYIINSPWNKLYKRKNIDFEFEENISLGEDLLFNLKYFGRFRNISFISGCPYFYIIQKGSLTQTYKSDMLDKCSMTYIASKKFIEEHSIGNGAVKDIANIFVVDVLCHLYDTYVSNEVDKKEKKDKIKYWIENSTVQDAIDYCEMETTFRKICVKTIKKKKVNRFRLLYFIKWKIAQRN